MHISFRATLLTLMLAVLLTAVAMLGTAAYLYARFAAANLGSQVLDQAASRVKQQVHHALDVAEQEAGTIAALIEQQWLNPEDHERTTDFLVASLATRPSLSYLSFGMPSGEYYHAFRDQEGELSALWLLPEADGSRRLREFTIRHDGSREPLRDIPGSVRTPPYERPYYRAAREAGQALWTESYVFLGSGESLDVPGVSRAVPVCSSDSDELLGVLTADFDLHALSRFLRDISLGGDGVCFLVEVASDGSPRIIAHPGAAHPDAEARLDLTEPSPDGEGRITVRADTVADPRVARVVTRLGPALSAAASTLQPIGITIDDRSYMGGYRHLGRPDGPNWVICLLLPEDEVFGGVDRMARLMVLVGLAGVLAATALSFLLSRRVAGYLRTIALETREVGQLRLGAKEPVQTRITEIRTLASAVEEMKTGLRSFQKYVPADLVRLLLQSGQEAELGGARKEITVYFSDIVGFTSISEQLSPDVLVELLSRYLDEMTGEILRHNGTVDKYIGDAIMAIWGAPRANPVHPVDACRAALACQTRLAKLRLKLEQEGRPLLHARIGLHTGPATVGNFGSATRLDYTAIGDTVNLASRLEGLNRIYGTSILISEATRCAVADHMWTRPIDNVAVQGKEQGVLVHELIAEKHAGEEELPTWYRRYAEALDQYFRQEWSAAHEGFTAVLELHPEDAAGRLMRDRCKAYLTLPPPAPWDGIFRAPK